MRDLFITLAVFGSMPFILRRPYIGILMWAWLSYMNPHRLAWGFATEFPFAEVIALATLTGMLFSKEPKNIPWTRESILLVLLILWMVLTTFFAIHSQLAWEKMEKVAKIQLMTFATLMLIQSRYRLHLLVWVIALSIAFFGIKGGIFTITHGGAYQVRGPWGSFIAGNNEIGLAIIMVIPLLRYLQLTSRKIWLRHGFAVSMWLCALAAIGTHSRGALVAGVVTGILFWFKSRKKFGATILLVFAVISVIFIMPQEWRDRMHTIENYQQDASALGRINAWKFAFNLAKARPLVGGGFESFQEDLFAIYAPDPEGVHDAHSIYFKMLAEHGFIGLGLFLLLGLFTWRTGTRIKKLAKNIAELQWAQDLASMLQVSLISYAIGGIFLGLSYFDLAYALVALMVLCKSIVERHLAEQPIAEVSVSTPKTVLTRRGVATGTTSGRGGPTTAPTSSTSIS